MKKFLLKKQEKLPKHLSEIKKELKKKEGKPAKKNWLTAEEKSLLEQIKRQTSELNQNNLSRTKAYLHFYNRHPEIHWAFLGHMVSRNGGWNMIDLKGEFLSRLLTKQEQKSFFTFLERGNWLIFQDAYPQFLLYEKSLQYHKNLFHLLPHLHVSSFMETIWNYFWTEKDSFLLTIALIINEQSYLEKRVLQNPYFQKKIFKSLEFKLQDYLSLNHILFPYSEHNKTVLIGQTLHHFESLHERILLGKRLYSVLFHNKERLMKVLQWANQHPHTGSRKDYWPALFSELKEKIPGTILKPRLKSCRLTAGAAKIYSPKLSVVWSNVKHEPAEIHDWFQHWQVIYYLLGSVEKINGEIEKDYCQALEKLELAAIAKKAITIFE